MAASIRQRSDHRRSRASSDRRALHRHRRHAARLHAPADFHDSSRRRRRRPQGSRFLAAVEDRYAAAAARRTQLLHARPSERRSLARRESGRGVDHRAPARVGLHRRRFRVGFHHRAARDAGVGERAHAAPAAAARRRARADHRRHRCGASAAGRFVDDERRDRRAVGARGVDVAAGVAAGDAEPAVVRAGNRRRPARRHGASIACRRLHDGERAAAQ